jgi:hypothetical protein
MNWKKNKMQISNYGQNPCKQQVEYEINFFRVYSRKQTNFKRNYNLIDKVHLRARIFSTFFAKEGFISFGMTILSTVPIQSHLFKNLFVEKSSRSFAIAKKAFPTFN